MNRSCTPVY